MAEPLGRFLGREAELEQVGAAIASSRLVTLIGPGGVGKTRLAVEAAGRLREQHPGGAWIIELAGVTDPQAVAPAAAGTLGAVRPALGDGQPSGSTAELIARHLAGRSLVIVLDNCEHVIDEAASLAHTLAGKVPGLRIVATSLRTPRCSRRDPHTDSRARIRASPSNSSWILPVPTNPDSNAKGRTKRSSAESPDE